MAKDIQVNVLNPTGAERDQLQRLADRLAAVKREIAEASAAEDDVRDELYERFDAIAGADSYVIFESAAPGAGWRMVREISQRRAYNVEGLRAVLTASQFKTVTRVDIDARALDVALRQGKVAAELVERYTSFSPQARGPLWKPSAGDIHLLPGQLAIVTRG